MIGRRRGAYTRPVCLLEGGRREIEGRSGVVAALLPSQVARGARRRWGVGPGHDRLRVRSRRSRSLVQHQVLRRPARTEQL